MFKFLSFSSLTLRISIMADNWPTQQNDSAVINLGDAEDFKVLDDSSDYETDDSKGGRRSDGQKSSTDDLKQRLQDNVTQMVWNAGTQRAKQAWSIYGNIDILRPYFNVEPHEVRTRLLYSFIPQTPSSQKQRIHKELYGPLMVIFTLIALLLLQMKAADHKVEEGTLMGTAFGVCFTYWWGASALLWFLSYVCNTRVTIVQLMSMLGYGLTSHCVVILLGTMIHTSHDHVFFYVLWVVIGGLSTLKMVCVVLSRTHGQTQRLILCCTMAAIHLLFLLYLHFAYHQIVEDLSHVFDSKPVVQAPVADITESIAAAAKPKLTNSSLVRDAGALHRSVAKAMVDVTAAAVGNIKSA